MATIDATGRPGYMYDEATDVWFEISGKVSTAANYQWLGAHQFDNNVTMNGALTATLKFNSFLNPAARLAAIPSPGVGLISFIQQDEIGNTINRFEYWNGSAWIAYADPATTTTLTGTQTLTNKTLTAPIINSATLAGGNFSNNTVDSAYLISPSEKITISATAATGTINFDCITQGIVYYTTNASANFTLNFRGSLTSTLNSIMSTGESLSVIFLNTNGVTAWYANAFQIDGTSVVPKWSGGTAPSSGSASAIDAYSFSIIKTDNAAFTVLASTGKFA